MDVDLLIKIGEMLMIEIDEIKDIQYKCLAEMPIKLTVILNSGISYDVNIDKAPQHLL